MQSIRVPPPLIPEAHLSAPPDPERRLRFLEVVRRRLREHVRAARPAVERFDVILRVRERVRRDDIAAAAAEARVLLARLMEAGR